MTTTMPPAARPPTIAPAQRREGETFEDLFGVPASDVLAAMDAADDDLVSCAPRIPIDLQHVGYSRSQVVVQVPDPFGSERVVPAVCDLRIGCGVPRTRRGLHISRLGDVVARSVQTSPESLEAYALALAQAASRSQYGGPAMVQVRARVPYVAAVARERDGCDGRDGRDAAPKASLEQITLLSRARVDGADAGVAASGSVGGPALDSGLQFTHIVACPCVQQTLRHARRLAGLATTLPALTHTQRCVTSVIARGLAGRFPCVAALAELDRVVVRTMNTLPRGAELALVYRAHRDPQFIEDALRGSLAAVGRALGTAQFASLSGRSTSAESIHEFDLQASATLSHDEVRDCLAPR